MYCLGDTTEFREKKGEGIIFCNNDELAPVVTSASLKASYLTDGDKAQLGTMATNRRKKVLIPFGTFTILEYVRYSRALVDERQLSRHGAHERIKCVGLKRKLGTKLKKLSPIEYRALCLAVRLDDNTHSVYVNFEGLKYCKKHRVSLKHFLELWGEKHKVYAMVSDARFVPRATRHKT